MASSFGSFCTKAYKAIKSLDIQQGKPVVDIVNPRKTVVPVAMASVLFFTWGLAYGLLDVMNVSSHLILHPLVSVDCDSITSALPWVPVVTRRRSWRSVTVSWPVTPAPVPLYADNDSQISPTW